jgi:hypothetical protein
MQIFQAIITGAMSEAINAKGWEEAGDLYPAVRAYRETMLDGSPSFRSEFLPAYTKVAEFDGDNMEEAFELMNLWRADERLRTVRGVPVRSLSVGDLIEKNGCLYMVDPVGFTEVMAEA